MNVLRPIQQEFYGDQYRWFFGTVINSQPPAGLEGRVKVRINGVHSPSTGDIPEKDLPWAQVIVPTTEGGISGLGKQPQIQAGAFVFGVFLDGASSQLPLVLGSLPRTELPTTVQTSRSISTISSFDYTDQKFINQVTLNFQDDDVAETNISLRRLQCMKFFIDNGYSVLHAAAITGGLEGVSNFITFDDGSGTFTGIALWLVVDDVGSRYQGLLRFSTQFEPKQDWKLFSVQLQYVLYELRNRFQAVNNKLLQTTDIETASKLFSEKYLLNTNDTANLSRRAYDEVING